MPAVCRRLAFLAFLAVLSGQGINKLRRFNVRPQIDSHPGHQSLVFCFHLVDSPLWKLYLICTRHLRSDDGIFSPCALHVGLKLLLS